MTDTIPAYPMTRAAGCPFAPVPYFWSDQYDLKIQAYGYLRGHDTVQIVDGDLAAGRGGRPWRPGETTARRSRNRFAAERLPPPPPGARIISA